MGALLCLSQVELSSLPDDDLPVVDEVHHETDSDALAERLLLAANRSDTGILLVEQALFDRAPESLRRDLEKRAMPILVPVPGAVFAPSECSAQDYILDLLRRAIGYRVRLQ